VRLSYTTKSKKLFKVVKRLGNLLFSTMHQDQLP